MKDEQWRKITQAHYDINISKMKKARCYYKNEASKVREIKPQSKNHEVGGKGAVFKITHEKTILEY